MNGDGTKVGVMVFVSGFCLTGSDYCSMDCKTCPNKTIKVSILISVGYAPKIKCIMFRALSQNNVRSITQELCVLLKF